MLIHRSNLLPHLMLFEGIFPGHLKVSKAKRYPLLCVDTQAQFIISNHPFTFRSAGQSWGTGRGGGCKIVIGPGLHSFGTNAIFCLSFLLEGMGIGCLSHLSYPQSRHLSPCITGCATTLCLGSGCGAGGDFTSMDRQTSASRGHRPCLYLPPPSPYLCERAQIHGQKGGGDSTPIPPPNTTKNLLDLPKTTETLQASAPFRPLPSLLSPQILAIPVPAISAPANTCLSTQSLQCTWVLLAQWVCLCTWNKYFWPLSKVFLHCSSDIWALTMFCQLKLLLRSHREQVGAVSCAPTPRHHDASPEKLTKGLAMKATAKKNLQSQ